MQLSSFVAGLGPATHALNQPVVKVAPIRVSGRGSVAPSSRASGGSFADKKAWMAATSAAMNECGEAAFAHPCDSFLFGKVFGLEDDRGAVQGAPRGMMPGYAVARE
jgi:hypothetical protein